MSNEVMILGIISDSKDLKNFLMRLLVCKMHEGMCNQSGGERALDSR